MGAHAGVQQGHAGGRKAAALQFGERALQRLTVVAHAQAPDLGADFGGRKREAAEPVGDRHMWV
jgi:hypothetical protein